MRQMPEGGKCPKTGNYVMIRSDLGCKKCDHKIKLVGDGKNLSVECSREDDEKKESR